MQPVGYAQQLPPSEAPASGATPFDAPGSLMHSLMQPIGQPMPQQQPFPGTPRCWWDYFFGPPVHALNQPYDGAAAAAPLCPEPSAPTPAVALAALNAAAQGALQLQELLQQAAQQCEPALLDGPALESFPEW